MTERTVTIGISIAGASAAESQLAAIRKQMDTIQGTVLKTSVQLNIQGQEQLTHFRRQLAAAQGTAQSTLKVNVEGGDQVRALQQQILKAKSQAKNIDLSTTYRQVALFQPTEKMAVAARARMATARPDTASTSAAKDFSALGSAITAKTIPPLAQYQSMLSSVLKAGVAIGPGVVSALGRVSAEFARQKELAAFWGISGFQQGVISFKSALSGFLSGSGTGFTGWLQNASANLAQYRTALTVAAAAMIGMAAAAALSSKHSQNYIKSTLNSRLMARKLPDKEGAEKWIESAQGTDWSAGRDSRMGTFQTVLSKNKGMGQKAAQKATEDIEKYFFANQEMLQKKGIASAEQLASEISAPQLTGDSAAKFEDIFGLGFSTISAPARLARLGTEAPNDKELEGAVNARPDEVLSKRVTATTQAMGDAVLPALNTVLGGFIKLSDIIGKIPGLGKAMGWGAVLLAAASAGLVMVSMVGSLIPGLMTVIGLISKAGIVTRLMAAAQWVLNVAMSANPLGIAIMAIAGLIVVLYALEKKFGLLTKTWQAFSNSSIGKGIFAYIESGKKSIEDLLATLGKAFRGGGMKGVVTMALDALGSASPMVKVLLILVDFIRKLYNNSNVLNKLFTGAATIWKAANDFLLGLWGTLKSLWSWLLSAIPGAKKELKRQEMVELADKQGLKFKAGTNQFYKEGGGVVAPSGKLAALFKEYQDLPGFAEGIADAVKQGISGIGETIAAKINGALEGIKTAITDALSNIPGFTSMVEALGNLKTKLEEFIQTIKDNWPSWAGGGAGEAPPVDPSTPPVAPTAYIHVDGTPGTMSAEVYKTLGADQQAAWKPQMARGGQIRATGSLIGHGGEMIDNAATVETGKTTLSRINEIFAERGSQLVGGGQSISISAPISIHVDKIDSSVDLETALAKAGDEFDRKLLFRLRNSLENGSTRGIGYLRG
ncbi:MAG: hypothetical protein WC455_21490 [Dehalococcoidia bacterium]|jgi:hypothetical protein